MKIFGDNARSKASKLLVDYAHSFRLAKTEFQQLESAVRRKTVSQPMRSSRSPMHSFTDFTKHRGDIVITSDVVVLPIFDAPIHDGSRFAKTSVFESASQIAQQPNFPDQPPLANDSLDYELFVEGNICAPNMIWIKFANLRTGLMHIWINYTEK